MSADIWDYANRFCENCEIPLTTTDEMCDSCADYFEELRS